MHETNERRVRNPEEASTPLLNYIGVCIHYRVYIDSKTTPFPLAVSPPRSTKWHSIAWKYHHSKQYKLYRKIT